MGKKKDGGGGGLGRSLIKERLQAGRGNKRGDTWVCNGNNLPTYLLNSKRSQFISLFTLLIDISYRDQL